MACGGKDNVNFESLTKVLDEMYGELKSGDKGVREILEQQEAEGFFEREDIEKYGEFLKKKVEENVTEMSKLSDKGQAAIAKKIRQRCSLSEDAEAWTPEDTAPSVSEEELKWIRGLHTAKESAEMMMGFLKDGKALPAITRKQVLKEVLMISGLQIVNEVLDWLDGDFTSRDTMKLLTAVKMNINAMERSQAELDDDEFMKIIRKGHIREQIRQMGKVLEKSEEGVYQMRQLVSNFKMRQEKDKEEGLLKEMLAQLDLVQRQQVPQQLEKKETDLLRYQNKKCAKH